MIAPATGPRPFVLSHLCFSELVGPTQATSASTLASKDLPRNPLEFEVANPTSRLHNLEFQTSNLRFEIFWLISGSIFLP